MTECDHPLKIDDDVFYEFDPYNKEHETVTEGRRYGSDVERAFNGGTTTFGNGNKFDIMLIK